MLSNVDILAGIQAGHIGIDPFDPSRLGPASYTLTLGSHLLVPYRGQGVIDPEMPYNAYEEVAIGDKGYVVRPGEFLLGSVAEKVSVPLHLAARLDARITLARLGLNALQGSTHIEPGQRGSNETLEISNIGPNPVRLRSGMKIVKIIFERLETPASRGYSGRYTGQRDARPR